MDFLSLVQKHFHPRRVALPIFPDGALKRFPDLHVQIEDMITEDDKVVAGNHWTATDAQSGKKLEFWRIVIWRIANRKIVERWAYLEAPHLARMA